MSSLDFVMPPTAAKTLSDFTSDEQPENKVQRILEKVQPLLTPAEKVEHVVVQTWKAFRFFPSALVLTNRRVFFVEDGLAKMAFHDMLWRNLADTHLHETLLGGVLQFRALDGSGFYVDKLPKDLARLAYAYGQSAEELSLEFRRQRHLEESRASAQGVAIAAPSHAFAPSLAASSGHSSVQALEELQQLHAKGLISDADFQQKKDEVLSRI